MKFAHIADVHVGSWRDPKLKDFSVLGFIKAIDEAIREEVDFVLIAGDLFNTALPGIDQLKTVIRKLKELKENGIPMYYIAGSHDFSPSGKTMLDVLEETDLGVNVTKGRIVNDMLVLDFTVDSRTGAKITGMIGKRGMLERLHYENLDKTNLEDEDGFKIFMFHTALDEMKPEHLKDMPSTPASFLPKGFDYYAGGHVHIVKEKDLSEHGYKLLVYPGPIFPANFSELEKLGFGTFYIYEDGKVSKKDVKIKDTLKVRVSVDGKSSEEASMLISEKLDVDVNDKIVLIRVEGKLSSGKTTDVNFKEIISKLYDSGAYYVLKNTTKLSSQEFEAVESEHGSTDEVEDEMIRENLNQIKNNFSNEFDATKNLMKVFSQEKHEGEKVSDYEDRIRKEASLIIEKEKNI